MRIELEEHRSSKVDGLVVISESWKILEGEGRQGPSVEDERVEEGEEQDGEQGRGLFRRGLRVSGRVERDVRTRGEKGWEKSGEGEDLEGEVRGVGIEFREELRKRERGESRARTHSESDPHGDVELVAASNSEGDHRVNVPLGVDAPDCER